jgi:hypothetical protein
MTILTLSDRIALAVCRSTGNPDGSCVAICRDCRRDSAAVAHEIANWLRERDGGASNTADTLYAVGCHQPESQAEGPVLSFDQEAMALAVGRELRRPDA